jgi:hypothetical protein
MLKQSPKGYYARRIGDPDRRRVGLGGNVADGNRIAAPTLKLLAVGNGLNSGRDQYPGLHLVLALDRPTLPMQKSTGVEGGERVSSVAREDGD